MRGVELLMVRFSERMVTDVVQTFWAAMQRGEFITDAAAEAGTYRKMGARWLAAEGGCFLVTVLATVQTVSRQPSHRWANRSRVPRRRSRGAPSRSHCWNCCLPRAGLLRSPTSSPRAFTVSRRAGYPPRWHPPTTGHHDYNRFARSGRV